MGSMHAVIIGAGGHAVSVAETVRSAGYELRGFTSTDDFGSTLLGLPVTADLPADHLESGGSVIIAIGDNATREAVWTRLSSIVSIDQLPAVCHKSAVIAPSAQLSPGAVVMQGVIVANQARIGVGALLNTGSILEHESSLGDFASLAPRAVTGGRVIVGARSAISIGAVLKHGLTIGEDTVVGGSSYLDRDLPSGVVAYGVPARVVRSRERGDAYLG
ncbi:MAG: acetyltransferase [Actinomycetota bacterium]|nr:acetyltransferase [Actinomycetota bacterium]